MARIPAVVKIILEGIAASIVAALILLFGAHLVPSLVYVVVSLAVATIKIIFTVVAAFALSEVVAVAMVVIVGAGIYGIPMKRLGKWRRGARIHSRYRHFVRREYLGQPLRRRMGLAVGCAVPLALILTVTYFLFTSRDRWKAVAILSDHITSRHAPIGRVGRMKTARPMQNLRDIQEYDLARLARIEKVASRMNSFMKQRTYITTRCGTALVPRPVEVHMLAELAVDLAGAPPIRKHEYVINEELLTGLIAAATSNDEWHLDCAELHRGYTKFFTTLAGLDMAYEFSIKKEGRSSLQMMLDEISISLISLRVGWLGEGNLGGGYWGFVSRMASSERQSEDTVRDLDSRIYSVEIEEGYMRIVTWRLPTVAAARSAYDVGYVCEAADYESVPAKGAESVGTAVEGDVVYILLDEGPWFYVCSEMTGRFGWLPRSVVTRLEA